MVVIAVLVVIASCAIPVFADSSDFTDNDQQQIRPTLIIKAPATVSTGEKFQIHVFERHSGQPVSRAGLWAVSVKNTDTVTNVSSAAAVEETGKFLGWTGDDGELVTVFKEPGMVLLVAIKDHYNPGFAWLSVRKASQLVVKSPVYARVGEPVTITVYDRMTGRPVSGAGVWAFKIINKSPTTENTEDLVAYATTYGIFFGETNNQGQVTGKFTKEGNYIIVATKNGYSPGIGKIVILGEKALAIRAPETVKINETFPLQVIEKTILTVVIPVPEASVWAVMTDKIKVLDAKSDLAVVAEKYGIYLGDTNERGFVEPEPTLGLPGTYWLIAVKQGYIPALSQITVLPVKPTIQPEQLQKLDRAVISEEISGMKK